MDEKVWKRYVEKETKGGRVPEGKRKYLHLDRKINFTRSHDLLKTYLEKKKNVAQKSFYPFIKKTLETPRYKFDKELGKKRIGFKEREICYASHFDALVYSFYSVILDSLYEKKLTSEDFSNSVTAYRKLGKSNIHFAKEVFDYISQKGVCVALALDISGFFDNLDHDILKKSWSKILETSGLPEDHYNLYKSLTKFAFIEQEEIFQEFGIGKYDYPSRICSPKMFRERVRKQEMIKVNKEDYGIPQGSPMSAVLSNIYMYNFDKKLSNCVKDIDGLYRRYSDDIIIVTDLDDLSFIRQKFQNILDEFKLKSKEEKRCIRFFRKSSEGNLRSFDKQKENKPLQYLGFIFDGQRALLRSSSISRYYRKMSDNVRETVKKTLGQGSHSDKVSKRKLYKRFTHKGAHNKDNPNFISYVYNASRIMDEKAIRKQVSNHVGKMNEIIKEKYNERDEKKNNN